jgi:hypothetical protein
LVAAYGYRADLKTAWMLFVAVRSMFESYAFSKSSSPFDALQAVARCLCIGRGCGLVRRLLDVSELHFLYRPYLVVVINKTNVGYKIA